MYCKHCGSSIDDGAKYCQHCGGEQYGEKKIVVNATVENHEDENKKNSALEMKKAEMAGEIFRLGLMSVIFPQTLIIAFLGIVFSLKAKSAVNEYKRQFGALTGRALAGHILSIPGLILGIVYTVITALYLLVIFFFFIIAIISVRLFLE